MHRHIGPAPDDEAITAYLEQMRDQDCVYKDEVLDELQDTLDDISDTGQPEIWGYGRLINFLTSGVDTAYLIHTCASALWELHGQKNADIHIIKNETDRDKKGDGA